ncbi:MAG TPA: high frequency lysogenization protein HflD [Spongiibacteraceae bacterium]|nr:high frequency lysogenization protein HflD [Spongiibacteraceae bacterium]
MTATERQALALAGILQATYLVDRIARTGNADSASTNGILHSLFVFDTDEPVEVYGGVHNLQLGLRILRDLIAGQRRDEYRGCIRYGMGILHLQKILASDLRMQTTIRSRLQHTGKNLDHFSQDINQISSNIAAIYQDTISHMRYRIQITGSIQQLQNNHNADRIRALLLAAVRSAWLWRRVGGTRWQLLMGRTKLLKAANALIER